MATGGLNVFRENALYVGAAKEAAWGTGVAPTWFYQWLDGSEANPEPKVKTEREGDASPFEALAYRQEQHEVIKIVEYGRPILAGYALQALLGTGSDTYTAPTVSGVLNAPVVAGATTFVTTASIGNVGASVPFNFTPGYTSSVYEVRLVNLTSRTGTGPYTYTLVAGQSFLYAHNTSDVVNNASTHAFARKLASYDPYSIEIGYNTDGGSLQQALRFIDAVCVQLDIESTKGNRLKFSHTWYATQAVKLSAFQTPTYETNSLPFGHFDASGLWLINNSATLNAAVIESFKLSLKNSTTAEDCQSEGLNPVYFLPGNMDLTGSYNVLFNDYSQYYETYWGGQRSPAANAVDNGSVLVGQEAFSTTWQRDGINSLLVSLPNIAYTAAKLSPKLDGKVLRQPVTFRAINNRAAGIVSPLAITLSNSQNAVY